MKLAEMLMEELNREAASTRRVLERVPEDKLSWTPHPKSLSMGQLALHIATVPGGVAELLSELSREVPSITYREATSLDEVLSAHDESIATASAKLASWGDEGLMAEWKMRRGPDTVMALPRVGMVRSVMLNHWYQHRGQLMVYLRLLGVPVPAVYGPSADENPFA